MRLKAMEGVELVVILPMAALNFTVMPRCVGTDQLVTDTMFFKRKLEHRLPIPLTLRESVCKLKAVVCLNALDCDTAPFEPLHTAFHEIGGGIGALLLVAIKKAQSRVFINSGVLVKF